MSNEQDPAKPTSNKEGFKPKNVAADEDHGRETRNMKDVPRGSEGDRRRNASVRHSDQG